MPRICPPQRLLTLAILFSGLPVFAASQTVITVTANASRHPINPNIYGTAWATAAQLADLNSPLNRYGGNSSSRYNWKLNADNRANDWFFESIPDASSTPGERGDTFVTTTRSGGAEPMITIPMLPYIAKVGANRSYLWSFSKAKYGSQASYDPWAGDAGNGVRPNGSLITGNDPNDANTANSASIQADWLTHFLNTFGSAATGGVKYYVMDNEPSLWNSTHRDVHPAGETMDELYNSYASYANAVRTADPTAMIVGPEEWGWTGYIYSGADAAYGATHGWGGTFPDRSTHGNLDHVAWFLQRMKQHQTTTGKQLLNVFSLHYYPQQGEFGNDDSAAMRAIRNRSTRSLWDPTYTDTSWINSVVQLIPRMKSWVSTYYPGLQCGITEYNWGDESRLNGATAQADIFGIFGRESLDMGTRWGTPPTNSVTYLAMKMYRNYDNLKSTFGETSVLCKVPNPDVLSSFASQRTSDGAMTVMVINKVSASTPVKINLVNYVPGTAAQVYQISSSAQTGIAHRGNVTLTGNTLSTTVPGQSITLFVVPQPTQFDFEGVTQNWKASGSPVYSVGNSSLQHFSGLQSLAVKLSGAAGSASVAVANPATPKGKTVTFHVWIPSDSAITTVEPYVLQPASGGSVRTATTKAIGALTSNAWNTITVKVPTNAVTPLAQLGVKFVTNAKWTGTCYVDAVGW